MIFLIEIYTMYSLGHIFQQSTKQQRTKANNNEYFADKLGYNEPSDFSTV